MARTRGAKGTAASKASSKPGKPDKEETTTPSTSRYSLSAQSTSPPKILILPNKATSEARVVSLQNPRYAKPTRYLICPETGAYEFIKVSAPKTTPRSWLVENTSRDEDDTFETQVTKGADLYLATPLDPLFLALPALLASQFAPGNGSGKKRMFLSSDDHLDAVADDQPGHLRDTLARWPTWRRRFETRMAAACDTVEGPPCGDGDVELLFRLSEDRLLAQVLAKARRMSEGGGLPPSMEDRFVTKALEAPVVGVRRTTTTQKTSDGGPVAAVLASEESTGVSSLSSSSSGSESNGESQVSLATTAATSVAGDEDGPGNSPQAPPCGTGDMAAAIQASPEVVRLQRLRVAFDFLCSSYVPPPMAVALKKMLLSEQVSSSSTSSTPSLSKAEDFAPLHDYVVRLANLRREAAASRSAADYSRKRGHDEENGERREKKRKMEEEEKRRKAGESRGVRDLKKVNTAGMKKLSAFFKPKGS